MKEYPYQVISPLGNVVLQATTDARYPRTQELRMIDAGFSFRLHGKKLTKADIRKEANSANPRK